MSDRLTEIKARLADTGAVRQSDATWLVEQLEQARACAALAYGWMCSARAWARRARHWSGQLDQAVAD
ncbi:hypothetical protein SAZ11_08090 [Streptomyces sp. FXJ1.4098]|nr:hypothetical protein [Streptomyces sp. FXJ1.4098]